jgi:hypothetical protein
MLLLGALQGVKGAAHGLQQYSSIRAIFVESGSGVIAGASNCSLLTGTQLCETSWLDIVIKFMFNMELLAVSC